MARLSCSFTPDDAMELFSDHDELVQEVIGVRQRVALPIRAEGRAKSDK
jgi:hypothetical protein